MTRRNIGVNINTMKNIREHIKEIIRERGPIRKVAEEIGFDHGNLIRMLREDQDPRIKTIEKIVDGLGYSLILRKKEVKKDKEGTVKIETAKKRKGGKSNVDL